MASSRPRRANAGSRMHLLLSGEMAMEALFEDDVLDDRELLANQTTESAERAVVVLTDEDSDDADFDDSSGRSMDENASEREDEDEDEDSADSDFRSDSSDGANDKDTLDEEPGAHVDELDDVERAKRRKRDQLDRILGLKTTARVPSTSSTVLSATNSDAAPRTMKQRSTTRPQAPFAAHGDLGRRSVRKSTKASTEEIVERERHANEKRAKLAMTHRAPQKAALLTHEQRLAEAVITEEYNRESLELFKQLELDKKRVKQDRKETRGTRIHFHSFAEYVVAPSHPSAESSGLPVANNSTSQHTYTHAEATDVAVDIVDIALAPGVDELDSRILPPFTEPTVPHPQQQIAVTRNLVTIINPEPGMRPATVLLGHSGADVGHTRGESIIRRSLCPITGHPAKYRDPLTGTPYATVEAFAAIRQIATGAVVWDAGTTIFHDKTPSDL